MSKMFFWQKIGLVSLMAVPMAETVAEAAGAYWPDGLLQFMFSSLLSGILGAAALAWMAYAKLRSALSKSPVDCVGPASAVLALSTAPQVAGMIISRAPISPISAAVVAAIAVLAGLELARGAGIGALGWALALLPAQAVARMAAWRQNGFTEIFVPVACLIIVTMVESTSVEAAKARSTESEK